MVTAYGYLSTVALEHGSAGRGIRQSTTTYGTHTALGFTIHPVESRTVYRNDDGTGAEKTSYAYSGWLRLQATRITTTLPVVSAEQNGPGSASTTAQKLDNYGRLISFTDADGYEQTTAYDGTGAVRSTTVDSATLKLTTVVAQLDRLGRALDVRDPNGNVTRTAYFENTDERRVVTTPATGPLQMVRVDRVRGYTETATGTSNGDAVHPGLEKFYALTRAWADHAGRVIETQRYFRLANVAYSAAQFGLQSGRGNDTATADGDPANYYQSDTAYDFAGRLSTSTDAVGTVAKMEYDAIGRSLSTFVGTAGNVFVPTQSQVYDGGGVGDGNVTRTTTYPGLLELHDGTSYLIHVEPHGVRVEAPHGREYHLPFSLDRCTCPGAKYNPGREGGCKHQAFCRASLPKVCGRFRKAPSTGRLAKCRPEEFADQFGGDAA